MSDNYEKGRVAHHQYLTSRQFTQFDRDLSGEDGAKLFLPPVPQDNMMVSRPLPKPYAEWIRGWDAAMKEQRGNNT